MCHYCFIAVVKLILRSKGYRIWARNSFEQERLVCGLSDIDWTIVLLDEQFDVQDEIEKIKIIKKALFFPFGELNVYLESDLLQVFRDANFFELMRDRPLVRFAESKKIVRSREGQNAEKVTFLLKMILADFENLQKRSHIRLKKWSGHYSDLNLPFEKLKTYFEKNDFSNILSELVHQMSELLSLTENDRSQFCEAITILIQMMSNREELNDETVDFKSNVWLAILVLNKIAYTDRTIPALGATQINIGHEIIRWELHAMYSQKFFLDNLENHRSNLNRFKNKHLLS